MTLMDKYKGLKASDKAKNEAAQPKPEVREPYLETRVTTVQAKPPLPEYKIIFSKILNDLLLLVDTEENRATLTASGIEDIVYTSAEVQELKGLTPESIRAHHEIKKTFRSSKIEKR